MKRLTLVPVLMLALVVSTSAFGWSGQWGNVYPFGGRPPWQCRPIAPGSLIQLIHAGSDMQIDDPIQYCMSKPDPWVAMDAWLAAGTPPVGDDTLRDETVFANYGPGFEGYFGKSITGSDSEQGDPWYTRYFTAAKYEIEEGDWYGEVGDPVNPDDQIYDLVLTGWDGEKYQFGDYTIRIRQCVPEPTTMAIGGIALLLGFFKRKK